MSNYIIKVENTSGDIGTVITDAGFSYTDNLNDLNQGQLRITGTGQTKRELFEIGSKVYFYKNSVLDFMGLVNDLSYLNAGGISADLKGYEVWLGKENGDYDDSPWTDTASATIATSVIGESNYFSAGTIETGEDIDLKLETSSTIWNGLSSVIKSTDQDIGIDYANLEIDILDHKGSSTSIATLNDNLQISDLTVRKSYPISNYVKVYGKGDGDNQIKSTSSYGQDSTSQSTYGIIQKDYTDSSIITVSQANNLADKLVAKWKEPVSVYEFDVVNPSLSVVAGDVLTLNAKTKGLNNEEVRVVGIERGIKSNREFLTLQVTNKEYSQKARSIEKYISELQKNSTTTQTYMQGTTNVLTFSGEINANSSAPLRIISYLPESDIKDEAGNIRVNSFTLDYDVDPYRSGVGTATVSEDNESPLLSGGAGSEDTLELYDSVSFSLTPSSSSWYFSLLSSLSLPTYDSDQYLMISVTIAADEDISSSSTGYTEFVLTDDGWENYQGHVTSYKGGYQVDDGDYLLNQSYTLNEWSSGSCEYGLGTDVYGYDLDIEVKAYTGYKDHTHSSLTGNAASHNHGVEVSIGDSVSDASSLNATGVNIYLDYLNGSVWVNKHSILNTGETIDDSVDLSNGGTYPDVAGYWRVRIFTNSTTPDLVQGVIKCKHAMDV